MMNIPAFEDVNRDESLILYGGSFNPPHLAHYLMVSAMRAYFPRAEVWILPTYKHAFDKSLMDYEVRCEMLRALFERWPRVTISTLERDLHDSTSYTVDIVRELHRRDPRRRLWIAVGADILPDLPKWRAYEEIVSMASFLVFPRMGCDEADTIPLVSLPGISSTEVRRCMAQNDWDAVRALVPAEVYDRLRRT